MGAGITQLVQRLAKGCSSQAVVPCTHTAGSKLRCQTPTKHTKNICEPLRVISVKHSSVLPDDGPHTIRNMLEWLYIDYQLDAPIIIYS